MKVYGLWTVRDEKQNNGNMIKFIEMLRNI